MTQLPDALVIGPMKAGTTWVHDFFKANGNVCLPSGVKETFYFDRYFEKGPRWYARHFRHYESSRHRRIVEVAPSYFHSLEAPGRVRRVLGEVPLVVTFRDPVKRSWSHYLHLLRYGYTKDDLQSAVSVFPQILAASRYAEMLHRWEKHFPATNIHAVWQEDLAADPETYASRLCEVLELPFAGIPNSAKKRANEAAVPLSPSLAVFGRRTSYALRSAGLYSIANLAKRLGFRRLFFGQPGYGYLPKLSEQDEDWLRGQLWADHESLPPEMRHPSVCSCSAALESSDDAGV